MAEIAPRTGPTGPSRLSRLAFPLTALVVGVAWAPMLGLHLTGEDYTLLARIDRGLEASPHVFRPLLGLWLAALHALFGATSAVPYHLGSLALHLANAALVFLLARRLFGSPWIGAACAAAFGLGAGVRDSLFWVAAVNRPLSSFGALLALNGLVRLGDRSARPALACALGLALQFGSNEDFYGTALVVMGWCAWDALRTHENRRAAASLILLSAGLLFVHYALIHRVPASESSPLSSPPAQVFESIRLRAEAVASGLGLPSSWGLALPVVGALAALGARAPRAAAFGAWAWVGSLIPFVLSDPVGYRFYPTQAPTVLLFVGGGLLLAARVAGKRALPVFFGLVLVFSLLGSRAERAAGLARWRAALVEISLCEAPLRELASAQPDDPPVSVNIETTTMGLVYYLWPSIPDASHVVFQGFLDAASGFVPPPEIAPGTWFGRRCEGSFGVIEPERYFAGRPALERFRLYPSAVVAGSLSEARSLLDSLAVDLTRTAVVEPGSAVELGLDPVDPVGADPGSATLEILEAFEVLVPNHSARMKIRVTSDGPVIFAVQDLWLFDPVYHLPPDQQIFSGVRSGRWFTLDAETHTGRVLESFPLNTYGLGVLVPAGEQTVEVGFRKLSVTELR